MDQRADLIDAKARSIKELLANREYGLDYYQRDYRWGERQLQELLEDLTKRFLGDYQPDHTRRAVASYSPYFLGSIVVSRREGTHYLIDGQQRLTTLTLLLIHLLHLADEAQAPQIAPLISSVHFGERRFNLFVPDRVRCLEALYEDLPFDPTGEPDGVINLYARYRDIVERWPELFPSETADDVLPYFVDWLLEKVTLVEIVTTDDDMAYEIFETMNDRGLSLTPTEMLKGYLLSKVSPATAVGAETRWQTEMSRLGQADKNADADFFKSWFRGSFAETIRDRRRDAVPEDFDLIGTQFHRWVRDHHADLGLNAPDDYERFLSRDLSRMVQHYLVIHHATMALTPDLEEVRYNHVLGVPLQATLLLAPVLPDDPDEVVRQKMRLVATYLDISFAGRFLNSRNYGYSPMHYNLFTQVVRPTRGKSPDELRATLGSLLAEQLDETPIVEGARRYYLQGRNGSQVKYLLARLTAFVDQQSDRTQTPGFDGYMDRVYEIEHVWANRYDRHLDQFNSEDAFSRVRNRIGALLLLPKDFNASFQDAPFEEKYDPYFGQNLLAQTLHANCYSNQSRFLAFKERSGLPFKAYPNGFTERSIEERQELYAQLCGRIWDPARLDEVLNGSEN